MSSTFSAESAVSLSDSKESGMRTVAFCEIDARCRRVLARRWPHVPCYDDVRALTTRRLQDDGIGAINVIAGGFPCQDISSASDAPAGIDGERSGLWREFARLIREIQPQFAIVENVSDLTVRGLDRVLGDLASLRYDAEWHCIPASAVGAPHPRDRIWIVAYPAQMLGEEQRGHQPSRILSRDGLLSLVENEGRGDPITAWWSTEPSVDRVVYGVPDRVDRFGELSNAVVPQLVEIIGRAIMNRCPYCHVDDGEGHKMDCWHNNHMRRVAEARKDSKDTSEHVNPSTK